MKPRTLFTPTGGAIRTHRDVDWKAGFIVALVLILLLGWTQRNDDRAAAQIEADAEAHSRGFSAGQAAGRADATDELTPRLSEAYQAGLNDALHAVRGRPEGLALAQACRAQAATLAGARR